MFPAGAVVSCSRGRSLRARRARAVVSCSRACCFRPRLQVSCARAYAEGRRRAHAYVSCTRARFLQARSFPARAVVLCVRGELARTFPARALVVFARVCRFRARVGFACVRGGSASCPRLRFLHTRTFPAGAVVSCTRGRSLRARGACAVVSCTRACCFRPRRQVSCARAMGDAGPSRGARSHAREGATGLVKRSVGAPSVRCGPYPASVRAPRDG